MTDCRLIPPDNSTGKGRFMIRFPQILSFIFAQCYLLVFFLLLNSFLPLRKNPVIKAAAFLVCGYLADCIIYPNDTSGLLGAMLLFFMFCCFIVVR